jgi:hypothetical protein
MSDMQNDIMFSGWAEVSCYGEGQSTIGFQRGCLCQYESKPVLTLRGLCPARRLDKQYILKQRGSDPSDLFIVGLGHTQMRYNEMGGHWSLTDAKFDVTGESEATKVSYLLGKNQWTIHDDTLCNKTLQREWTGQNMTTGDNKYKTWYSYTTQLKLTGCSEGQFTCDDGQCVAMEERCNQIPNCRDESDEENCMLFMLKRSYNKLIPPVIIVNEAIVPANVNVSIVLLKIVSMAEVEHSIDFKFEIILSWRENRAAYNNLKQNTALNALTMEDISVLWLPYVVYDNTDMNDAVQLEDGLKTTVVISREGSFTRSSSSSVDEIEHFRGEENALTMQQTYTKRFQCQYQLHRYPFDRQVK